MRTGWKTWRSSCKEYCVSKSSPAFSSPILLQLCPDADFTQELGGHIDRDTWATDKRGHDTLPSHSLSSRQGSPSRRLSSLQPSNGGPSTLDVDDIVPSDDEIGPASLAEGLKRLAVEPLDRRFHGKSSGVMLVQAALNLKKEYSGAEQPQQIDIPHTRRAEFWAPHSVSQETFEESLMLI